MESTSRSDTVEPIKILEHEEHGDTRQHLIFIFWNYYDGLTVDRPEN